MSNSLHLTADVHVGGSVKVGVAGNLALSVDAAVPVTTNATSRLLTWSRGASLHGLLGQNITLVFKLIDAQVYTVTFQRRWKTDDSAAHTQWRGEELAARGWQVCTA